MLGLQDLAKLVLWQFNKFIHLVFVWVWYYCYCHCSFESLLLSLLVLLSLVDVIVCVKVNAVAENRFWQYGIRPDLNKLVVARKIK